jgi:photosystem II stability/assembly factor-like uncharacterized protein
MKKLLPFLTLVGLVVLALGGTASAQPRTLTRAQTRPADVSPGQFSSAWARPADVTNPTVSAIDPATAYNDIDTRVTITGTGFATDGTGIIPPTVTLGTTTLTDVTFVNDTTLVANVPWGMDGGTYDLTITNPDGGAGSLSGAFTVTAGIGNWNGGTLFGGNVTSIQMKPGDPSTLYAEVYDVGGFRSTDAGEHWTYICGATTAGFVLDPLHPTWLYASRGATTNPGAWGFYRSTDEGDTWPTCVEARSSEHFPDAEAIYPSPHDPQTLFISSGVDFWTSSAKQSSRDTTDFGLIRSTDGGTTWKVVPDLVGVSVYSVAYHPTDPLQMVLATSDGRVFHSSDAGAHWSAVNAPPISDIGVIAYDPYNPGIVWAASYFWAPGPCQIYKSADAVFSGWQGVSPSAGAKTTFVSFTSPGTVHIMNNYTTDSGNDWAPYGSPGSTGALAMVPDDPNTGYSGDPLHGVQKTTDGGGSWDIMDQGLTGMYCYGMAVSQTDPLRIWANFGWPFGIHLTSDGATTWRFTEVPGLMVPIMTRQDPFDPTLVYTAANTGFYTSTDAGESWSGQAWNATPPLSGAWPTFIEPDPSQPGHLVANPGGALYSTSNHGGSWQLVTTPPAMANIRDVAFDPSTPGLVYLTTGGTGVWRSTDSGGTWARIDDKQQSSMLNTSGIYIATHPKKAVLVIADNSDGWRSTDGGVTWEWAEGAPGYVAPDFMFAGGDSTRLYAASRDGLWFSSDMADRWQRAAGSLGKIGVTALGCAVANDHTIIYAATAGGVVTTGSAASAKSGRAAITGRKVVDPGIYRRVVAKNTKTLRSTGSRDGWVLASDGTERTGGTTNAGASTLRIGDNAAAREYRSILSFNTGALPDHALITKVQLKVKRQGVTGGGNPVSDFRGFVAEVKKGVFGAARLQGSDFQAVPTRFRGPTKLAPVGGWYTFDLTSIRRYVINTRSASSGCTQIRLRFQRAYSDNDTANYLSLYSGNARASVRPQLIVSYYLP